MNNINFNYLCYRNQKPTIYEAISFYFDFQHPIFQLQLLPEEANPQKRNCQIHFPKHT